MRDMALYVAPWCAALLIACGANEETGTDTGSSSGSTGATVGSDSGSDAGDSSDSSDGSGGTPTGGDSETGAPAIDPRVAECLRIDACEAEGGAPIGLQACLGHALDVPWTWAAVGPQRAWLAAMDCKLAASDCEGVRACTPPLAGFTEACAGSFGGDLCQGDTWVFCDELGAPSAAMNCAAAGLECDSDVWAGCGTERCVFGATEPSCDGDVLVECSPAGFVTRIDCPTQYNFVNVSGEDSELVFSIAGETCGFDEQRGALGCVGTGAACDFFSQQCDGDVLETCAGGHLARRECAKVEPAGQGCGFVQSGPFAGAASCGLLAGVCDLGADESCEDGVIAFCDWDAPGSVDCVAAGYSGCATQQRGDRRVAFCTP